MVVQFICFFRKLCDVLKDLYVFTECVGQGLVLCWMMSKDSGYKYIQLMCCLLQKGVELVEDSKTNMKPWDTDL